MVETSQAHACQGRSAVYLPSVIVGFIGLLRATVGVARGLRGVALPPERTGMRQFIVSLHRAPGASLILLAFLATLLGLLPPALVSAQATGLPTGSAYSQAATPCLDRQQFITTRLADTIFAPADASTAALVTFTPGATFDVTSVPIGSRSAPAPDTLITNGVGAIYGLAYDDGAISGRPRLFMAAFTRRFSSYGPGGPGGVYVYDLSTQTWAHAFTVPNAGSARSGGSITDTWGISNAGRTGLGDIAISPDGRTLYIVNIAARRIERYDISQAGTYSPLGAIPLDGARAALSLSPAAWTDTIPFALAFYPGVFPTGPALVVGFTDTMARSPAGAPVAYVATYFVGSGTWAPSLAQNLHANGLANRFAGSAIQVALDAWNDSIAPARGWNAWTDNLPLMARVASDTRDLTHPQPLLTEITFAPDGQTMYLGFRDRTGDQVFFTAPPAGDFSAIAQGDTLVYRNQGGWQLQTVTRFDRANTDPLDPRTLLAAATDVFNDNTHAFQRLGNELPPHIENHMGGLAQLPIDQSVTPQQHYVATNQLMGNITTGAALYRGHGGVAEATVRTTIGTHGLSKVSALGDLEPLCTYAFVSGRVWEDRDTNGIQDSGEPGLASVSVELVLGSPDDGRARFVPAHATAVTDAQGRYRFAVPPNRPFVIRLAAGQFFPGQRFEGYTFTRANSGADDTRDSDAHPAWRFIEVRGSRASPTAGLTGIAIVQPEREEDRRSLDIGLAPHRNDAAIGDTVWWDINQNGRQEPGEPTLTGAELNQLSMFLIEDPRMPSFGDAPILARNHAGPGTYRFTVRPGAYAVRFGNLPSGASITVPTVGPDDRDSDALPATGQTRVVEVAPGQHFNDLDLGLTGLTNLSVSLSAPAWMPLNDAYDYTVRVQNTSQRPAEHVELTLDLPPHVTFASASNGGSVSGRTVRWNLGTEGPGIDRIFTVRVHTPLTVTPPRPPQLMIATATVRTSTAESTLADNTAATTTALVRTELQLTKTAPAEVTLGDLARITLTVDNLGAGSAWGLVIEDPLPAGMEFVSFETAPGCSYTLTTRTVRCDIYELRDTMPQTFSFLVRPTVDAPPTVVNTARITSIGWHSGDDPANNTATASTRVRFPDPAITGVTITPDPLPVGEDATLTVRFRNLGDGVARDLRVYIPFLPDGTIYGPLPAPCRPFSTGILCFNGSGYSLPPASAEQTLTFPIRLPATPRDAATFDPDSFAVTAQTWMQTYPERLQDTANNTGSATAPVTRPNVYVDAEGPDRIVARGSVFWYTIDYGNLVRHRPSDRTRAAEQVVLRAVLPGDVTLIRAQRDGALFSPTRQNGQILEWHLGTLAPGAGGRLTVLVQTSVTAGRRLPFAAEIRTDTPGDDPVDNHDALETEVVPPPDIALAGGMLRLAVHSELDPNSRDGDPTNGVYVTDGATLSWPAGEVLDFTPRLREVTFANEPLPWPYAYRARVVGWSVVGYEVNGAALDPGVCASDRIPASGVPALLRGCVYGYVGGENLDGLRAPRPITENEMQRQAHAYWSRPPLPAMRSDVSIMPVDPLEPVRITVAVEIEVWIVNAYPGEIDGVPVPEIPVAPLPDPERQVITETFTVNLVVPRSVLGPGN